MKKALFLLVLGLIVFTGCKDNINEILKEISVSDKSVSFDKNGGKKEITVTSEESWAVTVNDSWITTTPDGNKLIVEVAENLIDVDRKGTIFIMARGVEPIAIGINQQAGDIQFSFSPSSVSFKARGGSQVIEVMTSANVQINAISSAKWLKAKVVDGKVLVSAIANNTDNARTAIVKVKVGELIQDIKIDQEAPLSFILPLLPLEVPLDFVDVNSFELERGSAIEQFKEDKSIKAKLFTFRTLSKKVPHIQYYFNNIPVQGEVLSSAYTVVNIKDSWDEYKNLLKSNGFDYVFTDKYSKNQVYSKTDNGHIVNLELVFFPKDSIVTSQFDVSKQKAVAPKQPSDYPTFDKVPYEFGKFNVSKEEVHAWEEQNGGSNPKDQKHPQLPILIREYPVKNQEGTLARAYFFSMEKVNGKESTRLFQISTVYKPIQKALYLDANKNFYPTKEFEALIAADGFVFRAVKGERARVNYSFESAQKSILLALAVSRSDLKISLFELPKKETVSSSKNYSNMPFDERVKAYLNDSSSKQPISYKGYDIYLNR